MRLLNIWTYELQEFFDEETPCYFILSHRWGDKEISYKDFSKGRNRDWPGYRKIIDFCNFARTRTPALQILSDKTEGTDWVWIDTCCIDKRSSAELSEAINSMYAWYNKARECYVYLVDVSNEASVDGDGILVGLRGSVWFTRGWTLQELLAPLTTVFVDVDWKIIGHVCHLCLSHGGICDLPRNNVSRNMPRYLPRNGVSLCGQIASITGIDKWYLTKQTDIRSACIAEKMSWAAKRKTTRLEDEAYCLLGIFGINMPMLYGEGRKAFLRLQQEIIKTSTDCSILAWEHAVMSRKRQPVLATSPSAFADWTGVMNYDHRVREPYALTNNGLGLRVRLREARSQSPSFVSTYLLTLPGISQDDTHSEAFVIALDKHERYGRYYRRSLNGEIPNDAGRELDEEVIYLATGLEA